jgi:hypothetical protein
LHAVAEVVVIQAGEESTARTLALLWWAIQIVKLPQPYSP